MHHFYVARVEAGQRKLCSRLKSRRGSHHIKVPPEPDCIIKQQCKNSLSRQKACPAESESRAGKSSVLVVLLFPTSMMGCSATLQHHIFDSETHVASQESALRKSSLKALSCQCFLHSHHDIAVLGLPNRIHRTPSQEDQHNGKGCCAF